MNEDPKICYHMGIIMDGNRRYAKSLGLPKWKGHKFGAEKTESVIEWAYDLNIPELTLYTFSAQNFDRPKYEVTVLMKLFSKEINGYLKSESSGI